MTNIDTYADSSIVDWYEQFDVSFGAEEEIFRIVEREYPHMRMLDLGVGAGRTTRFFADRCGQYVGADYAEPMVVRCRNLFDHSFHCLDARDLSMFGPDEFDFVLFSFNGIDCIPYEDRKRVFAEVKRVCSGFFAFSTHNMLAAKGVFDFPTISGPKALLRYAALLALNFPHWRRLSGEQTTLNDGVHKFGLRVCYVKPERQVKDLVESGFSDIRMFEKGSGKELHSTNFDDYHPYFLCRTRA